MTLSKKIKKAIGGHVKAWAEFSDWLKKEKGLCVETLSDGETEKLRREFEKADIMASWEKQK